MIETEVRIAIMIDLIELRIRIVDLKGLIDLKNERKEVIRIQTRKMIVIFRSMSGVLHF